ncbi:MAG: UPF0104 family protein [Alphaproteobacteria bacterium]|nr:UPF0104 family protein [Alphaproteobacteria bacterium]
MKYFHRFAPLISLAMFGLALWILSREFGSLKLADVYRELAALPTRTVVLAVAFAIGSYWSLTAYDLLGLRHVAKRAPYAKVASASFMSFAFSHNLGFALVTGSTMRFRIYSAYGLNALEIGQIVVLCVVISTFGFIAVAAAALLLLPDAVVAAAKVPEWMARGLGATMIVLTAAYLGYAALMHRPFKVGSVLLSLPRFDVTVGLIVVSAVDMALASAVLFVLLPEGTGLSYYAFMGLYVIAVVIGILTHVPGGLGVFESVILLAMPGGTSEALVGALIMYRLIYFILPLAAALLLLTAHEIQVFRRPFRPPTSRE